MYDDVIAILKAYSMKKVRIGQLCFELEHPSQIGEKELIDSLSLGHSPLGGGTQSGHVSDRTMEIALHYKDVMRRMNSETVSEIMRELRELEADVRRTDLYLSYLEERHEQIIRLHYVEGVSISRVCRELRISKRTVMKYRIEALVELTTMYSYLDDVKKKKD